MNNFCVVCRGTGNVGSFPRFWTCGPCGGSGVQVQHGPALYLVKGKAK